MGFREAKYMIIIMIVTMFVCYAFSQEIPSLSGLNTNNKLNEFYNSDTGKLQGGASNFESWTEVNADNTLVSGGLFDFAFTAWDWLKGVVNVLFSFLYSPYELVKGMYLTAGGNETIGFLWWLPPLIGIIWTFGYAITFFMILWKE